MHIHMFISGLAPAGKQLMAALQDTLSSYPVIQYYSIEAMEQVLPVSCHGHGIAVIMVANNDELTMLARKNNVFGTLKTILILPDWEPGTVRLGNALRPRYMTLMDSDFSDVIVVLNRIRKNLAKSTAGEQEPNLQPETVRHGS